ncbi:DegT/DnrJ/EryC1/StrS family aminotransferase [Kiloniella majae]|uniref:DegT/DnrJ/EryC1/StrS family aminotransferase n=1 Tax=Kiloniella majae TaxID=1938558 RepID=UPI000A276F8E|nr:DegT/DnrJ/EryC1/StrS family aminotransferase [Kiloniella majae]
MHAVDLFKYFCATLIYIIWVFYYILRCQFKFLGQPLISLFTPDMPSAQELLPYLDLIDRDKWYSNYGPRLREFEGKIADFYNLPDCNVTTTSSATTGLMAALRETVSLISSAQGGRFKCLLPAWTFVASAQAVVEAGGEVLFCDVDPTSGALTPSIVAEYLRATGNQRPDLIMPVAPFGATICVPDWDAFSIEFDIPIVIDAAASFYSLIPGISPAVVSLHATKAFGIGEGGVVVTQNKDFVSKIRQRCGFGFLNGRTALSVGGNYKVSEYHAAVGLAQFDRIDLLRTRYLKVKQQYLSILRGCEKIFFFPGEELNVSSTINVIILSGEAEYIVSRLRALGVGASIWWEDRLHCNALFNPNLARNLFPVSDYFYDKVVALPFHSQMSEDEMMKVIKGIRSVL